MEANRKSTAPTVGFYVICNDSAPSTGSEGECKDMTNVFPYVSISKFIADMHVEI